MGNIPVAKPAPGPRWPFARRGLAIACVLLGLVALGGVALATAWPTGPKVDNGPHWVTMANVDDLQVDQPVHNLQYKIWLVKDAGGSIADFYDTSPSVERCVINWGSDIIFDNQRGWFRSACHGDMYDINGTCMYECPRDMDRYPLRVTGDSVQVEFGGRPIEGPVKDSSEISSHATDAELAPR